MRKIVCAAAAAVLLAACSTTIRETTPPGASPAAHQPVAVGEVHGSATATVPGDLVARLTRAIREETGAASGQPANLEFNVLEYREVSATARALAGMLVGNDHMKVHVTVRDPSGAVLRQFDVERKANPGGLGTVTDAEKGLIEATAKAVGQTLAK